MSRQPTLSPLHPACGYRCDTCRDTIVYVQTEVRTLYYMAVEETEPKEIYRAHMEYLAYPNDMRMSEIPEKICCTCGEKLMVDMLPAEQASELIRACYKIDIANEHLCRWDQTGLHLNQVIASSHFSELNSWWRTDLPCLRAALNTAWRAGISGISMIILSNMFEKCVLEELLAADDTEDDEPADLVIPSIMIPKKYTYYRNERVEPLSADYWDGLSEQTVREICEGSYYDWDVVDQAWFQEHKHLIA
jgi:hypothetical protein